MVMLYSFVKDKKLKHKRDEEGVKHYFESTIKLHDKSYKQMSDQAFSLRLIDVWKYA